MAMDVTLIQGEGIEVTVYVHVTDAGGRPRVKLLDERGRALCAPSPVDDRGNMSTTLSLKVGHHTITAELADGSGQSGSDHIDVEGKKRSPVGIVGWAITGLYILAILKWSYATITVVGFLGAMITLAIVAKGNAGDTGENFVARVSDNNWVYYTTRTLAFIATGLFIASFVGKPLPELNPLVYFWGEIVEAVRPPQVDPLAQYRWSTRVLRFFLGNEGGWGSAAVSFWIWTIIAKPVCFWDDWVESRRSGGTGGGVLGWLINTLVSVASHGVVKKVAGR